MTRVRAVVFDFDGTIIDTETPVYESWADTFRTCDVEPIPIDVWRAQIGQSSASSLDERKILCDALGVEELPADVEHHRRTRRDEMLADLDLRAGVRDWIDACRSAGVALAIGSSSPSVWVNRHLDERGLREVFPVVSCADPGIPGKPDPTVYLTACRELGVDPAAAIAIEDSPHGVTAAIEAGMRCIAAPGPMTAQGNFGHATRHVASLADTDPAEWLA